MKPIPSTMTMYSHPTLLLQAKNHYESMSPSSITLHDFFSKEFYPTLRQTVLGVHLKPHYNPVQYRFSFGMLGVTDAVFMHEQVSRVLCSISGFSSVTVLGVYSFGSCDYTILHDDVGGFKRNGLGSLPCDFGALAIFDFSGDWDPTWGGRDVFVDGTGNFVYVPVRGNTCTLISLGSVERFVEYVNHYAQERKRYVVICGLK